MFKTRLSSGLTFSAAICALALSTFPGCGAPGGTDGGTGGGAGGGGGGSGGGAGGGCGGSGGGSGAGGGGGTGTCGTTFAGCSVYTDRTQACDARTITFGLPNPTPQCLRVKVGQTVTFNGSGTAHPLSQACGPTNAIGMGVSTTQVVTFGTAGDYGYYCDFHGGTNGSGMSGSIRVDP